MPGIGATLVLIGESDRQGPRAAWPVPGDRGITVWYSAPSILALMAEYGGIGRPGASAPRLVLFAGEVFPVAPLRKLRRAWPSMPKMWNLYGPTETNVCTAFPIPETIDRRPRGPLPDRPGVRAGDSSGSSTSMAASPPGRRCGRAGRGRPRGDARLLREPRTDRPGLLPRRRGGLVPDRRPRLRRRQRLPHGSTADATGWSRSAATGSSWARSRPRSTATRASTARP